MAPPSSTTSVDPVAAAALQEAYNLSIEISCSPRALAVCAPALRKSVANYIPGVMNTTLRIPPKAVAPPAVASAVSAWYRSRPVKVVVDLNGPNPYRPGDSNYEPSTVYISGEIAVGLVASYEQRVANPHLWHRHLLLTAVAMSHEMFRQLRYLTHRAIGPAYLAKHDPSELWSYTTGHHAAPVCIGGINHQSGKAGWWWEDKTFGGSFDGLVYDSIDPPPCQQAPRRLSAVAGASPAVPVRFIKAIALRSGIIPGLWRELAQDVIDGLCTEPSTYPLPLPVTSLFLHEKNDKLPIHLRRNGDLPGANIPPLNIFQNHLREDLTPSR